MNTSLAVLIPSRGLPHDEAMEALDMELERLFFVHNVFAHRRWARRKTMPDCRNYLVHILLKLSEDVKYVLWMDDDMVCPPSAILQMVSILSSSPPEVAGVACQAFSSSLGLPPSPGEGKDYKVVSCLKPYKLSQKYPEDWWFTREGGLAFSLWKRDVFGLLKKPIFSEPKGEDHELFGAIHERGWFIRALPEVVVGHRYVKQFRTKGSQVDGEEYWNGLHEIGSYEEIADRYK